MRDLGPFRAVLWLWLLTGCAPSFDSCTKSFGAHCEGADMCVGDPQNNPVACCRTQPDASPICALEDECIKVAAGEPCRADGECISPAHCVGDRCECPFPMCPDAGVQCNLDPWTCASTCCRGECSSSGCVTCSIDGPCRWPPSDAGAGDAVAAGDAAAVGDAALDASVADAGAD